MISVLNPNPPQSAHETALLAFHRREDVLYTIRLRPITDFITQKPSAGPCEAQGVRWLGAGCPGGFYKETAPPGVAASPRRQLRTL